MSNSLPHSQLKKKYLHVHVFFCLYRVSRESARKAVAYLTAYLFSQAMKVPTFIKKITAKKDGRTTSSGSANNVETRGIEEVLGLNDNVVLKHHPGESEKGLNDNIVLKHHPGESEKESFSEHLPVDSSKKMESDVTEEAISSSDTNARPRCIPSFHMLSSERPGDDTTTLTSTDRHYVETVLVHDAIPPRRRSRRLSSNRSGDSLSMLLNDDIMSETSDDDRNLFKIESLRSQVPLRGMSGGSTRSKRTIGNLSMSMRSISHAMGSTTGRCPFKHGTVYSTPYPGYAHGNRKRGICPNGCKAEMNSDITEDETAAETMSREAIWNCITMNEMRT